MMSVVLVAESEMQAIASACVRECVRQEVDLVRLGWLLIAYNHTMTVADELPTEDAVRMLAEGIEPSINHTVAWNYRQMPVTFASGGSAAEWRDVPDAMNRLFAHLDRDTDPTEFVHALLKIHPFRDGNGRVAFIVFNWLSGTLRDPQPLPDLFGEATS